MIYTLGIDVGFSSVKSALFSFKEDCNKEEMLALDCEVIRKQSISEVVSSSVERVLSKNELELSDIAYLATTGEGSVINYQTGHFYSMTSHARGAIYLNSEVRSVIDIGALYARALVMDHRSKVLESRMTSQCSSGLGQFLENITGFMGISLDEVGELSLKSTHPAPISNVCTVLAETDVINMVSQKIAIEDIVKGIHVSMSRRVVNLLRSVGAKGQTLLTGGLANDVGFIKTLREVAGKAGLEVDLLTHDLSLYAGAIGAAIWGGFRYPKMKERAS